MGNNMRSFNMSRIGSFLTSFVITGLATGVITIAMAPVAQAKLSLKEGQDFPSLKIAEFPGKAKLDAAKFKGKVVIVDFWASWCEPCKIELPALNKLHKKFGGKVTVIGVNVDENLSDAKAFLKDHPVGFDLAHDKGMKSANALGIEKMPTSFILANGKIIKIHEAFRQGDEAKMEAEIKKALSGG
ncbi:TlpA disulfide reductase family protein [soil metagenome]